MKSFGCPIIYINDHYQLWRSDIDQLITHCTNEYSENIIHKIAPSFDEYIFIKPDPGNDPLKLRIRVWSQFNVIFKLCSFEIA